MKYARFEQLVLVVGAVAVVGTLALSPVGSSVGIAEIVAQLLILAVLAAAVHFGANGGFVAALVASVGYVMLRIPLIADSITSGSVLILLTSRILAYGLVGVVGGHACARVKYLLGRLEDADSIDDWSGVFNQRFAAGSLDRAVARLDRYGEEFSTLLVKLSPSLTVDLRPARQRALVRSVASHVRSDVRMVDEVARLDDGRFFVMMPHTGKSGGEVVSARVASGVRRLLGARDESVKVRCLAGREDRTAIDALLGELVAPEVAQEDAPEYRSEGSSTRNPASTSAVSAPGSSTLITSTAASPEGATKQ